MELHPTPDSWRVALFTAFGFALARLLWARGALRILTLAASLTVSEWLRGHLFTGFPWNVYGYGLTEWLPFAQTLRLVSLDPSRNRARVYTFTWQPTLWGEWALIRAWGRIARPTDKTRTGFSPM